MSYADDFWQFYTLLPKRYRGVSKRRFIKALKAARLAFEGKQVRPMSRFSRTFYMLMVELEETSYYGEEE